MNSNLHRQSGTRKAVIRVHGFGYPHITVENIHHIEWKYPFDLSLFLLIVDRCTPRFVDGKWGQTLCPTTDNLFEALWPDDPTNVVWNNQFQIGMRDVSRTVRSYAMLASPSLEIPEDAPLVVHENGKLVISDFYEVYYDVPHFEAAYSVAVANHNVLAKWQAARRMYTAVFLNFGSADPWVLNRRASLEAMRQTLDCGLLRMKKGITEEEPIAV